MWRSKKRPGCEGGAPCGDFPCDECGEECEWVDEDDSGDDEPLHVEDVSKTVVQKPTYQDLGITAFIDKIAPSVSSGFGDYRKPGAAPVLAQTWLAGLVTYLDEERKRSESVTCDGCLTPEPGKRIHAHNILSASVLNYYSPQTVIGFARYYYNFGIEVHPRLRLKLLEPDAALRAVVATWSDWVPNLHQTRQTLEKLCVALSKQQDVAVQVRMLSKMRFCVWLEMDKSSESVASDVELSFPKLDSKGPEKSKMNKPFQCVNSSIGDAVFSVAGDNAKKYGFALQCTECEESQGDEPLLGRWPDKAGARLRKYIQDCCYGCPALLSMDLAALALEDVWAAFRLGAKKQYGYVFGLPLASTKNWHLFMIYYTACMMEASLGASPFRKEENVVFKGAAYYR